jgi:hypothetical protein
MSYLHLSRTRTRERSPSPPFRSNIRRDTKRSRFITFSEDEDDGHDDYPYSSSHRLVKSSPALTIRNQPSQLKRYNIWSDENKRFERTSRCDGDGDHHYPYESQFWSSGMFRRKEKWVDESWETREWCPRSQFRENSFWDNRGFWSDHGKESEEKTWSRYRKIERTKTEEPLSRW